MLILKNFSFSSMFWENEITDWSFQVRDKFDYCLVLQTIQDKIRDEKIITDIINKSMLLSLLFYVYHFILVYYFM